MTCTSAKVTFQLHIFSLTLPNSAFGLPLISSHVRGDDVTGEESGSSADERVCAPRSALRELKQRVKLHSDFDANLSAAARPSTCVFGVVSAELMLVSRDCC